VLTVNADTQDEMNNNRADTPRACHVPLTSPNFVNDELLLVDVIVDIHRRTSEHVVTILQHNRTLQWGQYDRR